MDSLRLISRSFVGRIPLLAFLAWTVVLTAHQVSSTQITVFNDVPAHFEVFAGAVAMLRLHMQVEPQIIWVTHTSHSVSSQKENEKPPGSIWTWLGEKGDHPNWHYLRLSTSSKAPGMKDQLRPFVTWNHSDIVMCISPELDYTEGCHALASILGARFIVAVLHRADLVNRNARFLSDPPCPILILTLAPHVAKAMSHRLHGMHLPISWASFIAPYNSSEPCTNRSCLKGFVIQGTVRKWGSGSKGGLIRNYKGLWEQMLNHTDFHHNVTVLGKGHRHDLGIPKVLDHRISMKSDLSYPKFWQVIHTSYALVPAFGNNHYLKTRISSTILASLITCVPIIATEKHIAVYNFFSEEHVFLQHSNETEVDTMMRIVQMDEEVIFGKRRALCELQEKLGRQAAQLLNGMLTDKVE